jgi:hypothetical protein
MRAAIKTAWEHGGADFQSRFDKSTAQAEQMKEGSAAGAAVDILNTTRDTIPSLKLLEVKRMATPAADKFIQIATSVVSLTLLSIW